VNTGNMLWRPAYIGLGGNLGNPRDSFEAACTSLGRLPGTRVISRSSLYQSAPFGDVPQPDYLNAVVTLLTHIEPHELLAEMLTIEHAAGRRRDGLRWGPRVLDLDLLVYSNETIDRPDLLVPHPGIRQRNFVLLPLAEVAPDLHVPGLGRVASLPVSSDEPRIARIH
jgi:2-amino-4-hydroxy-6-hydroxymethyldihydropteridine diphosphokinase